MKSPVKRWKSRTMTGPVAISDSPMSVGSHETVDPAQKRWPQLAWNGSESLRVGEIEFFLSIDPNTYSVPSTTDRFVLLKAKGQIDFLARHAPTNVKNIVDIGIYKGGSVVLYQELFSPKRIVGLDLSSTREDALDRYVIRRSLGETIRLYYKTDQADRELLSTIIGENFGEEPLDLVIDDACHLYEPTKASFNLLFPRLRPGGVYVIEDWGWAHWDDAYHQSATHNYADEKTALSKLILEFVMVSATRPTVISEVHIRSAMAYLVRGSAVISPGSDIASSYLSSGRQLLTD
jgi:predicted O-methyltransferase YrrM